MTSLRLERETNHNLPQGTHMYIQPFSTSVCIWVVWRWVLGWSACYTISVPFMRNRLVHLLERNIRNRVLHKRWTPDCKHWVSEHLKLIPKNILLNVVVWIIFSVPSSVQKSLMESVHLKKNDIYDIAIFKWDLRSRMRNSGQELFCSS